MRKKAHSWYGNMKNRDENKKKTTKCERTKRFGVVLSAFSVAHDDADARSFGHVTYLAEQFIREIGETHKKVPAAKNYYVFVYVLSDCVCICASIRPHTLPLPYLSHSSLAQFTLTVYRQTCSV